MAGIEKDYYNILEGLKEKIRLARQKAALAVNRELLQVYWEIGNAILQQQKEEGWGKKIISRLVKDLKSEFADMKGLSERNLVYMQTFAGAWPYFPFTQAPPAQLEKAENQKIAITQAPLAQLTWYHHTTLLDKLKDQKIREFYIQKAVENGWSRNIMLHQIESQLHLRQGNAITNFAHTLPAAQSDLARETLKNPYLFDFLSIGEEMQERELEKALILHIKKFMLELGRGFAYVGNQYNLNVEGDDFFLDLLFYNYHMHCFVVFELKVGEFKPEFAGKLNFYINTINDQIKGRDDKPTIGVLLCKTPNETVVKYSLQGIDTPMGVADYEFTNALPKQLKGEMPTIEELEQEIEKEVNEYKENLNPVDARLQAIKEKLKGIKTEEIQTQVTFPIITKLYKEGLRPLFEEVINRFSVFDEDFRDIHYGWVIETLRTDKLITIDAYFDNEDNVMQRKELIFFYNLPTFKKSGTEPLGEHLRLKIEMQEYWYGFKLENYNRQEPFLKKLYHQPLTTEDQQQIIDLLMNTVMDRIDWIIEYLKNKEARSIN